MTDKDWQFINTCLTEDVDTDYITRTCAHLFSTLSDEDLNNYDTLVMINALIEKAINNEKTKLNTTGMFGGNNPMEGRSLFFWKIK